MKKVPTIVAALSVVATNFGCANTSEGVRRDAEVNSEKASQEANQTIEQAGKAGQQASVALRLTPRLKLAITAIPELNDSRNQIDVDSTTDTVTLKGHVYSEDLRRTAEDVVREEMSKAGASQRLQNQLLVAK